ncbi:acyltransferase 3 [Beutenbergia cavernae DSM 12333]|uniref:Acyltransferase 3 n=1 Tax=Beutenbergia cavernae (strain ATCC BAA-8 / DSM 12333 / CCUG 43141 / JCM 11478 / NBRC 16432 / NCIMB 13614 / HKI 0122) TaxID=471853 RepID=C5C126_BEUC1|nr:acyltransferase family protein [Beutenbergia cavernae]ACQ79430.1 acyltransferase 3 [Beutenbergia cavernae DSM 12333]
MSGERVWRADLEGLRAVAIGLVAVFHVWVGRVSGGVDVFLLISGFFVGGALLRRVSGVGVGGVGADDGTLHLGAYLARLARRLLPTMLVVLAAVVVGTALWLPRTRWSDVAGEVLASLGYAENWRLAFGGQAYGAADPTISPLQHVWSLSVQGQLFVALPLLLVALAWLTRRAGGGPHEVRRVVVGAAAALAAASFAYALVSVTRDQPFAYYDTGARAWEYLAGALVAALLTRWAPAGPIRFAAGWLGLAAVLAAGWVVDGGTSFPGVATLVPVLGAVALVVAGAGPGRPGGASRLLAWRPLAVAGGYAYEFYLWHWVVLVFALAAFDRDRMGWLAGSTVLLTSAVLAWLTRRVTTFAPRAVRAVAARHATGLTAPRPLLARAPALLAGTVALTLAGTGWFVYLDRERAASAGLEWDATSHPGALALVDPAVWPTPDGVQLLPDLLDAAGDLPATTTDGCVVGWDTVEPVACDYGDPESEQTLVLVGGSHTESFFPAFAAVAQERGLHIRTYLKVGCYMSEDETARLHDLSPYEACFTWRENVTRILETEHADDVVVSTSTRFVPDGPGDVVPGGFVDWFERLGDAGVTVLALRDNPVPQLGIPTCLEEHADAPEACAQPRAQLLSTPDPVSEAGLPANVRPVDLSAVFCTETTCPAVQGNVVVYRDDQHLTATYARTIAPALDDALGPALGWW